MTAEWYFREEGAIRGPYDLETMRGFARSGVVARSTEVSVAARPDAWIAAEGTDVFRSPPSSPTASSPEPPRPRTVARAAQIVALVVVLGIGGHAVVDWYRGPTFADTDVRHVVAGIRALYVGRGLEVVDVQMVRRARRELTGFVTVKSGAFSTTQNCSASMDESSGHIVYECRP